MRPNICPSYHNSSTYLCAAIVCVRYECKSVICNSCTHFIPIRNLQIHYDLGTEMAHLGLTQWETRILVPIFE